MTKTITVNEMMEWSWEQVESASIETLKSSSYGIKNFCFCASPTDYTEEKEKKLNRLRERLKEIKVKKVKHDPVIETVKADCGHYVPKHMVMMASLGSSCPNCYDKMSD
jgi:hypothetical protein